MTFLSDMFFLYFVENQRIGIGTYLALINFVLFLVFRKGNR